VIKLLWRTDVHYADQTPSSRKDDWVETVGDKLRQVGSLAKQHGCAAVLDGGDFFNDKTPIRTSHRLVSKIAEIHSGYPCPVYANVGNHDLRLAQLSNLDQGPLGSLFATGVFKRLYDKHELVIEQDGVTVRVVGIPYHGPRYDLDRIRNIQRGTEDWLVVVCHLLASPQGGEMFQNEDIIKYDDLFQLNPDVDVFFFGHWHKNQGIVEHLGEDGKPHWIVNTGSLTRGSLTEDNIEREPGVVLLEFGEGGPEFEFIKLKIRPAEEVFDLDKRVKEEARAMTVNAFVESVKAELQSSDQRSFQDIVDAMDSVPHEIRERALEYIENA
jgi:DNA repair exonuclease SbcCD nuclease subunit